MNIKIVRNKIKAITNVKKITQAMQLVSAIKMKKAQQEALEATPYQQFLEQSVSRFIKRLDSDQSDLLTAKNPHADSLLIVVTTNKGLCGGFNANLLRFLLKNIDIKKSAFITVGKKGTTILNQLGATIIADFSETTSGEETSAVFQLALGSFLKGTYSSVQLVYNRFISSLRYDPLIVSLLPIRLEKFEQEKITKILDKEYLIEPSPEVVVKALLENYIEEKIRFSILQTAAGEHSARMIAMKNATDNANDVVYNLTLLRNKLRQQKITYELLDMITAKESVENLN